MKTGSLKVVHEPWFVRSGHDPESYHELFKRSDNGASAKIALFFDRKPAKDTARVLNAHQALLSACEAAWSAIKEQRMLLLRRHSESVCTEMLKALEACHTALHLAKGEAL